MSHLTTIIVRVKSRLEVAGGDTKKAVKDSLFRKAVKGLHDYIIAESDYSPDELDIANELIDKYSKLVMG